MRRGGGRGSSSSGISWCYWLLLLLWILVAIWFIFLYQFHFQSIKKAGIALPTALEMKAALRKGGGQKTIVINDTTDADTKIDLILQYQDAPFHVVFSTDCSFFQSWQSLMLFYSATQVKQQGAITRIASGCDEAAKNELRDLYKKLYPGGQFNVHFTPDFKHDGKSGKKYDFYNKPYGMEHWLENAHPPVTDGSIVALIDPDMIFLRPLTAKVAGNENNIYLHYTESKLKDPKRKFKEELVPTRVERGQPVAQIYGLGAPWAAKSGRASTNFNRTEVCGADSACLKVDIPFGEEFFSVGPPYLVERSDMYRITKTWTRMVPKVYSRYPELLAEMYAYSMAAAHERLPHFTMRQYMLSNTEMDEEGWKWVDQLGDRVCEPAVDGIYYPGKTMATIFHYCQFFRAGEFGFQKRRVNKNFFKCDAPLLVEPPQDLGKINYKNRDGDIIKLTQKQARRNAFSLCVISTAINNMLVDYKEKMCGHDFNTTRSVNLANIKY